MKSLRLLTLFFVLCAFGNAFAQTSEGKYHALRLRPGQDLKKELAKYMEQRGLRACAVVTCVGSLTRANLRFADQPDGSVVEGPLEIVALTGCGGMGRWHLHLAVSDAHGRTSGGHLMDGSIVRTTAEIVLLELSDLEFERVHDPESGYLELEVRGRQSEKP